MGRSIRWTRRALARLDAIAQHIGNDNPERAQTFVGELRSQLDLLRRHTPGTPGRVFGTKELVLHKNYIAVYRIVGDEVQVITLLHAAQQR